VTRVIELEQVTKRFPGGSVAVDSLSLEVPSGTVTVLVGSSGSGKTTTLRMINRMEEPTSGRILIDGTDVLQRPAHLLRRGIGYVIQQAGLFPHRTVIDNICTVPRLLGWSRQKARGRAKEMMALVGLDPVLGSRYPAQLSGGQQQRVGVARALATEPPVLLMDEPFGAVDPVVRAQLQVEFTQLQRRLGTTVVFVTHDIAEALVLGDRIAVLGDRAKLHQYATPAELLAAPADDFVIGFVGPDRHVALLGLIAAKDVPQRAVGSLPADVVVSTLPRIDVTSPGATARWMLDAALATPSGYVVTTDAADIATGVVHLADVAATGLQNADG
jgi:osmoprotectant transport system ATP-binding protein